MCFWVLGADAWDGHGLRENKFTWEKKDPPGSAYSFQNMGIVRRGDNRKSATELGMSLGDEIWRRGERVKIWGLPTCFTSCLFLWPSWLESPQGIPAGVGGFDKAVDGGRKMGWEYLCDPQGMRQGGRGGCSGPSAMKLEMVLQSLGKRKERWRSAVILPSSLALWPVDSQGMPAGVCVWHNRISSVSEGWRGRSVCMTHWRLEQSGRGGCIR